MFGFGKRKEERAGVTVTQSAPDFLRVFGIEATAHVSMEQALGVPAVWAAINFLAGTIAGIPLHVYDKTTTGKKRVADTRANPVVAMLHDAVNDSLSSFQ